MNIGLMTYPTKFIKKPTTNSVYGKISNHFSQTNEVNYLNDISELSDLISEVGAIMPAVYDANGFAGSNIIAIDFDDTATADIVLKHAKDNHIMPNIVYKTLGCSKRKVNKFRFIYVFDCVLTDELEYDRLTKTFHYIFKDYADKYAKGVKRWFFTGSKLDKKEIYYVNESVTEVNYILAAFTYILQSIHASQVAIEKKLVDQSSFIIPNNNMIIYQGLDESDISSVCQLYVDFKSGIRLNHEEKMVLMTSLNYVEHGANHFLGNLIDGITTKSRKKWEYAVNYCIDKKYMPITCKSRCRFHKVCQGKTLYNKLSEISASVIEKKRNMCPELVSDMFTNDIGSTVRSKPNNDDIFIFKVPPGIGKTTKVIERFCHSGVIAFPNHELKDEKVDEYEKFHNEIPHFTCNLKDIVTDEEDLVEISHAYKRGDVETPKKIISKYPNGVEYLRTRGIPLVNSVFTTHEKTLRAKYDDTVSTVIYDEDPIDSLFKIKHIYDLAEDVEKIINHKKELGLNKNHITFLTKLTASIGKHQYPTEFTFSEYEEKHRWQIVVKLKSANKKHLHLDLKNNISELVMANVFCSNSYSIVTELPKKRVFILSATPDIDFYREAYPDRNVYVSQYDNVKRKGTIKHVPISTTKKAIVDKEIVEQIKEQSPHGNIITFKKFKGLFDIDARMPHGGNVLGYNYLSGKDISVAYTYQKPAIYYAHKVIQQGHSLSKNWKSLSYKKVFHGGNSFMFGCFNNIYMAKSQIHTIESEMYQAVERARTIRQDVKVTIFSKFIPSFL